MCMIFVRPIVHNWIQRFKHVHRTQLDVTKQHFQVVSVEVVAKIVAMFKWMHIRRWLMCVAKQIYAIQAHRWRSLPWSSWWWLRRFSFVECEQRSIRLKHFVFYHSSAFFYFHCMLVLVLLVYSLNLIIITIIIVPFFFAARALVFFVEQIDAFTIQPFSTPTIDSLDIFRVKCAMF